MNKDYLKNFLDKYYKRNNFFNIGTHDAISTKFL